MIAIDLDFAEFLWQYHISTTFFVSVVAPVLYYVYVRYFSNSNSKYPPLAMPKLVHPIPDEAKPHWKGKRLYPPNIGTHVSGEPNKIQSYCPATGQYLGTFDCTTPLEIDAQIARAAEAQKEWRNSLFAVRKQVLRTISRFLLDHQHDVARVACRDTGKTRVDASMGEIMVTLEKIAWIVAHGERALRTSPRAGSASRLLGWLKAGEVRYEPLGVVAAVVSWNYPLHNALGPIVAALFTGNAIAVKCSEQVVWLTTWFVGLVHQALRAHGVSEDLVQLCCCFPGDAAHFTGHPGIAHMTFIGLRPVAQEVLAEAARNVTPCVVELGGKDPVVVLQGADVPTVALVVMRGTFQSAGQNCIGIERVICEDAVYDAMVGQLESRVARLRVGSDIDQLDEIDMGAMILDNRFASLEALVTEAVAQGARLVTGGRRHVHPNYPQGHYFAPTLLVDVTGDMAIARTEVFGPVLTVMRARDVNDAVALANGTAYGLGASVFGPHAVCCEVASRLEAGNVAINDFATFYVCQLPFGGCKQSGYGKFGGEEGLQGLCNAKSVVMDKPIWRLLRVRTAIPPAVDYPIPDDKKAWGFVSSLNTASYDTRLWRVLNAFKRLAKGGA